MKKRFKFLEHTADVYIAAYGGSLEEAFESSAMATFEVMTDLEKIESKEVDIVKVKAHDRYALLYNWLEELLVLFETTGKLYSRFEIPKIKETPFGFEFEARAWGEPYDSKKHLQKVGVKAVTYHQMKIKEKAEKVTINFILDI